MRWTELNNHVAFYGDDTDVGFISRYPGEQRWEAVIFDKKGDDAVKTSFVTRDEAEAFVQNCWRMIRHGH